MSPIYVPVEYISKRRRDSARTSELLLAAARTFLDARPGRADAIGAAAGLASADEPKLVMPKATFCEWRAWYACTPTKEARSVSTDAKRTSVRFMQLNRGQGTSRNAVTDAKNASGASQNGM